MRADHDPQTSGADLVAVPRAQLDSLVARLEAVEAELAHRRARPDTTAATPPLPGRVGRRQALAGLAGAAVAGTAAVVAGADPVAAANGDPLKVATANTATGGTALTVTGTPSHGFAVIDQSFGSLAAFPSAVVGIARTHLEYGVHGYIDHFSATAGVFGQATDGVGVKGTADTGIGASFSTDTTNDNFCAVLANGNDVTGILARGQTQLRLAPNGGAVPPQSTTRGQFGQLRWILQSGEVNDLWACVGEGTPGTWRKVVGKTTAGAFHLLPTPVRVYDSRPGTQPTQAPKTPLPAGNVARTIDLKVNGSTVPVDATGVVLTVLLVNATSGGGNLTVWAADKAKPAATTVVWGGSAGRFTATALTAVDAQARVKVDASLQTNLVLDVVGYYR